MAVQVRKQLAEIYEVSAHPLIDALSGNFEIALEDGEEDMEEEIEIDDVDENEKDEDEENPSTFVRSLPPGPSVSRIYSFWNFLCRLERCR